MYPTSSIIDLDLASLTLNKHKKRRGKAELTQRHLNRSLGRVVSIFLSSVSTKNDRTTEIQNPSTKKSAADIKKKD